MEAFEHAVGLGGGLESRLAFAAGEGFQTTALLLVSRSHRHADHVF
jgi:hypothetical protein